MKVVMLGTYRGVADGHSALRRYHKGVLYDLPSTLAKSFLCAGKAYNAESDPVEDLASDAAELVYQAMNPRNPEDQLANLRTLLEERAVNRAFHERAMKAGEK